MGSGVVVTGITPRDINAALDLLDRQQPVRVFCVPWVPEGFPERPDFIVVPPTTAQTPAIPGRPAIRRGLRVRLAARVAP